MITTRNPGSRSRSSMGTTYSRLRFFITHNCWALCSLIVALLDICNGRDMGQGVRD